MMRSIKARGAVILAFVLVVVVNYLSNALPIAGRTMSEISASYSTLFTPAGFTFGIWGVIYVSLLGFVIFQALPGQATNGRIAKIAPLFILNCLLNAVWIFVWHYDFIGLALLIMLGILGTLILIYRALRRSGQPASLLERTFVWLPFSLYLAWIIAATIANFSILQVDTGTESAGLSEVGWTIGKLAFVGAAGTIVALRNRDIAFILVIAWAAFGISNKQAEVPIVSGAGITLSVLGLFLAGYLAVSSIREQLIR